MLCKELRSSGVAWPKGNLSCAPRPDLCCMARDRVADLSLEAHGGPVLEDGEL